MNILDKIVENKKEEVEFQKKNLPLSHLEELKKIKKEKKINEDNLRVLSNCLIELGTLKESFYWRMVKVLKQNHMID